ncbi:MAG: FxsA family protein [Pseudomonadales bacterium]
MKQSVQNYLMPYLFLLFLFMPVIEIWLIIQVGSSIGAGWTIMLIFFTAFLGAILLRQQGFSTLFRARQKMDDGQVPAGEMLEGLMLAFAGALMLTPGFVTDAVGFLLLLPPVRALLIHRFKTNMVFVASGGRYRQYETDSSGEEIIIEGECRHENENSDKKLR